MKLWRRVSAVWLCVLLLVPLLAQPARAAEVYPDKGVGFWKMMSGWVGVRAWKSFLDIGVTEETATEDDWRDAYERYTDDLRTKTGTATVIDGGVRLYFTALSTQWGHIIKDFSGGTVFSGSGYYSDSLQNYSVYFNSIEVPFTANYRYGYSILFDNMTLGSGNSYWLDKSGFVNKNSTLAFDYAFFKPIDMYKAFSFRGSLYVDLIPYTGNLGDYYDVDIGPNSRVGTITGPIGYYGDNGNLVVDNKQIFDESTKIFYNPATGETGTVNNWSYDYVDRSYGLELDGGKVGKVVYGDDHATVTLTDSNGNIVNYNYYYMGNGGGNGGGSGGDGEDKESIWDKLGGLLGSGIKAILGMVEALLSKVLDGLIALVDMMAAKLQVVVSGMLDLFDAVPSLFGGFMEFFGALFAFLPQEILYLLQFGFFAAILIGLIRLLLNR